MYREILKKKELWHGAKNILEIINLMKLESSLITRYIFIISDKFVKYYNDELKTEIVAMWEFSK